MGVRCSNHTNTDYIVKKCGFWYKLIFHVSLCRCSETKCTSTHDPWYIEGGWKSKARSGEKIRRRWSFQDEDPPCKCSLKPSCYWTFAWIQNDTWTARTLFGFEDGLPIHVPFGDTFQALPAKRLAEFGHGSPPAKRSACASSGSSMPEVILLCSTFLQVTIWYGFAVNQFPFVGSSSGTFSWSLGSVYHSTYSKGGLSREAKVWCP